METRLTRVTRGGISILFKPAENVLTDNMPTDEGNLAMLKSNFEVARLKAERARRDVEFAREAVIIAERKLARAETEVKRASWALDWFNACPVDQHDNQDDYLCDTDYCDGSDPIY